MPVTPESVVSYSIGKGGDRVVSMSAYGDQKNGLPGSESWFKSNSIKALGGGGGEYSSGSAPGGGGIGYVGDISRRPTNGEPNTGSGGGSFYISGSNVSGGCHSGAGGSGIIILRYMKYK